MEAALASNAGRDIRDCIVWDNHACLPLRPNDVTFLPQLERFRESGVTLVSLNVGFDVEPIELHVRMLAHFRRFVLSNPNEYVLVERVADIAAAKRSGRLGIVFDIEGAKAIGDQLSLIELYYDLGVRWMLIAYNRANLVGGGCMDPTDAGLTAYGARVIDEMARVGMVTCCSHTGERTSFDVIEHAKNPVIFSHSNPRALWDHPRNINDGVIRACAAKGGVICINGVSAFLGDENARSETVARHVDYVAKLAGIDHVALGLDYVFDNDEVLAYIRAHPQTFGTDEASFVNFAAPEQIPEIAECLQKLGYASSDIERVLGLNLLRIAQIWK